MERIAQARNARELSQGDLAKMIGTSQQQIARFEKPGADVKSSVLIKLSDALDVSISWLLGLTDDPRMAVSPSIDGLSSDERYLVSCFRALSAKNRETILTIAASLKSSSEELDGDSGSYRHAANE